MSEMLADLPSLTFSYFDGCRDTTPIMRDLDWSEVVAEFSQHRRTSRKDGAAFSPVSYLSGATRKLDGVETVYAAVADVDSGLPVEEFLAILPHDLEVHVASSFSSTPEHPKYRAITPLDPPVPASEWPEAWARIQEYVWHGVSDKATKDASRLFYLPACPPDGEPFVHHREGQALDWRTLPPAAQTPPPEAKPAVVASVPSTRAPSAPEVGPDGTLVSFGTGVDNDPDDRPGDRFNEQADWVDILGPHGWELVRMTGEARCWRCPNSDKPPGGHCATTGHTEADTLHVFCGAEGTPFEGGENYSKFGAYALLEHGGDLSVAAAALRDQGYGRPSATRSSIGKPTSARRSLRFLTASEMTDRKPPEPLIDGILYRDSLAVEDGPPGSFKSFTVLDMALSVASGIAWQGHAVHQGAVLYICAEGAAGVSKRIKAWCIAHGLRAPDRCVFLPESVNFLDPQAVKDLCEAIQALPEPPVFVVVDTYARSMPGGDENSSKDTGLAIAAMDALRQATGATVLALHHVNRSAGEIRGHSSLLGAIDTELKTSANGRTLTLKCAKQKDAEEFDPITLQGRVIELDDGDTSLVFEAAGATALTSDQNRVFSLLCACFGDEGATASQWLRVCLEHHISESSFYRARKLLVECGRVEADGGEKKRGARYRPAPLLSLPIRPDSKPDSDRATALALGVRATEVADSNRSDHDQEGDAGNCQAFTELSLLSDTLAPIGVSQQGGSLEPPLTPTADSNIGTAELELHAPAYPRPLPRAA